MFIANVLNIAYNVRATKQFKYHISAGPEQSLDLASCI